MKTPRSFSRRAVLGIIGSGAAMAPLLPRMVFASPNPKPGRRLLWKRPVLRSPVTIDVNDNTPNRLTQNLDPDQDYIIRLGRATNGIVRRQGIGISGGRHIQIIGGHLIRPEGTAASDATGKRAQTASEMLGIFDHTGIAYVEGPAD